ncbi:MAG: DDE-type integrase/transposase/recombinase [Methylococcales bacterium]|nr:DDE-type integrase/transposase/recombinase [Methylococcales bacterium]
MGISYLPTTVKGQFYYLYLVLDVFSRKIVGWQVFAEESSQLASQLMRDICQSEGISAQQVTLHSDNGSPMKGATMLATLQQLGIAASFSRPAVSNDNPYSASLFKTLKYRPDYPLKAFKDLTCARQWVSTLLDWYNHEHRHSGIRFVTPAKRHQGLDRQILTHRHQLYQAARQANPQRWQGQTRNWTTIDRVLLNPDQDQQPTGG